MLQFLIATPCHFDAVWVNFRIGFSFTIINETLPCLKCKPLSLGVGKTQQFTFNFNYI